jgi:DNA-binding transcriptional regulator LsrR (DeoR family)
MDARLESLLRLTAKLYYQDGLSQTQIGNLLGLSRPKVSRLLTRASNEGIVHISVKEFEPRNAALETELKAQFNLNDAIVIRIVGALDIESVRSTVGYLSAPFLSQWVLPNTIIGISGSRSLFRLIEHMQPPSGTRGAVVVQLMGNIGASVSYFDAIENCRKLADTFRGVYYTLNAPAIATDAESCQTFMAHHDVRAVWDLYGAMQIAFVGIGSLSHSSFIEREVIAPSEVERLRACGAVGEMCGRFYDNQGQECLPELQDRVVAIRLDELRTIREVVAVTAGIGRAEAVLAAMRGGLIKSLVIDEAGARAILDMSARDDGNLLRRHAVQAPV